MSDPLWAFAAGCVPDVSPWQIPEIARAGGFASCGMWVEPDNGWDSVALTRTRRALAATGVQLIDVEPLWLEKPIDVQKEIISAGVELGAKNVLVVSREPDQEQALDRFCQLCEFAGTDIRLALEFGTFTEVKSLRQALAFIDQAKHPTAGVLIDQMHLNRSGEALPDLNDSRFPYIQACDFDGASAAKTAHEYIIAAVDERRPLGEGDANVEETNRIRSSDIDVSLEIRSKALREQYPDPVERARQIFERCSRSSFPVA